MEVKASCILNIWMERTAARLELNPCYLSLKKILDIPVLRNYPKSKTAFVYCKNFGKLLCESNHEWKALSRHPGFYEWNNELRLKCIIYLHRAKITVNYHQLRLCFFSPSFLSMPQSATAVCVCSCSNGWVKTFEVLLINICRFPTMFI